MLARTLKTAKVHRPLAVESGLESLEFNDF